MDNTGIFPRFYTKAVENKGRSEEEGRPVFIEREWVEIRIAGDRGTVIDKKVTDEERERWPDIYQAFKRKQDQPIEGFPIEQWPVLSVARVAELKAMSILTVEALADLPDGRLKVLGMEGRELQNKAKAFLAAAKDSALEQKQAALIARLEAKVELLEGQIKELGEKPRQRRSKTKPKQESEAA